MVRIMAAAVVGLLLLSADPCQADPPTVVPLSATAPAPDDNPTTPEKVHLGAQLFFDPRLSGDNTMSCATCHRPELAFADGVPLAAGRDEVLLKRNTQSCLNVAFFETLFWDGRVVSLEEQALAPLLSAEEMHQDLDELEQELNAIPGYVQQFQRVFGEPPNRHRVAQALAAYQRTLISADSPFDRFLAGDQQALSPEARRGWELFRGDAGCIECHHGPLLSDNKYYRLGVSYRDDGRSAVSEDGEDRYRFRTPSLRNVADTAPYMHDGSLNTLDSVVAFYYREIPEQGPNGLHPDTEALHGQSFSEIPALVAFLKSLSGTLPDPTPPRLPALLAGEPETWISPARREANGVLVHQIESPYQRGITELRVLLPDKLPANALLPIVYVLPVEAHDENRYGNGLQEILTHDLHNRYSAIFVAPTFSELPWYADHATRTDLRHESCFVRVVIPFIEQTYPVQPGAGSRHLLGFSKSGWGAFSLALRHPDQFAAAAAWDAPLMMETMGRYGTTAAFGSQEQFTQYRVVDRLQACKGRPSLPRLILTGYGNFRDHHQQAHELLEQLQIAHVYRDGPSRDHHWNSGWVSEAVEALLHRDAVEE